MIKLYDELVSYLIVESKIFYQKEDLQSQNKFLIFSLQLLVLIKDAQIINSQQSLIYYYFINIRLLLIKYAMYLEDLLNHLMIENFIML